MLACFPGRYLDDDSGPADGHAACKSMNQQAFEVWNPDGSS